MAKHNTQPAGEASNSLPALTYKGEVIHERHEMLSLTDMWRAAGGDEQRAPAKWRTLPTAKAFIGHVALTVGKSDSDLFVTQNGGRTRGTWAHWHVALAYAKYLDHAFHMWCNTVVRERMEGLPQLSYGLSANDFNMIGKRVAAIIEDKLDRALMRKLPAWLEDKLQTDERAVAVAYKPALLILIEKKVPSSKRRAFSLRVSASLRNFCADRGYLMRKSRESGRWLFPVDGINAWLAYEGERMIRDHIASTSRQGTLALVQS